MPAIPFETLTQLHETDGETESVDFFQSIELDKVQYIEEVYQNSVIKQEPLDIESIEDNENIPDIDDFEDQNLLLTNDPVYFIN